MRKTLTLTIADEGRDKGKTFILTEMPADQGERWALRALLALTNAGADLPDGAEKAGMAGLAAMGVEALGRLKFEAASPLLDEMWSCVKYQHRPGQPLQDILDGANSQIEEIGTRLKLRMELLKLHTSPFLPDESPSTALPRRGRVRAG